MKLSWKPHLQASSSCKSKAHGRFGGFWKSYFGFVMEDRLRSFYFCFDCIRFFHACYFFIWNGHRSCKENKQSNHNPLQTRHYEIAKDLIRCYNLTTLKLVKLHYYRIWWVLLLIIIFFVCLFARCQGSLLSLMGVYVKCYTVFFLTNKRVKANTLLPI